MPPNDLHVVMTALAPRMGCVLLAFCALGLLEWVLEVFWSDGVPWRRYFKEDK